MSVTLNYTSKGLIDAIQKQLAQQKSEGKISGDIGYKSIATCDFWSTIKTINDNHDRKNKVYHGKGFTCDERGTDTNWAKSVIVYGSTTFTDEEWEMLVRSMGLELTSKAKDEPKVQEPIKEEPAPVEETTTPVPSEETITPAPVEKEEENFAMGRAVMGVLMTELIPELEKAGYDSKLCAHAAKITQTKLKCKVVLNTDGKLEISQQGNKLSKPAYLALLFAELAKEQSINQEKEN